MDKENLIEEKQKLLDLIKKLNKKNSGEIIDYWLMEHIEE